ESPAELAKNVQCLMICAGDGKSVQDLLFGQDGAAKTLGIGSIVIDHTTISPYEAEEIGKKLLAQKVQFLDAPVTGGDQGARNGTLTTMVGGDEEIFEVAKPVISTYSGKVIRIGPAGYGQRMKAVNQICSVLNALTVSEAFNFATRLGLDLQQC